MRGGEGGQVVLECYLDREKAERQWRGGVAVGERRGGERRQDGDEAVGEGRGGERRQDGGGTAVKKWRGGESKMRWGIIFPPP